MHTASVLAPRAALLRLAATALVFGALYNGCNQLTQGRSGIGQGVFGWEHAMPFVPWTIVPYLSIVGFFVLSFLVGRERRALDRHVAALAIDLVISVLCWLLVPLRFAFERPPVDDWTAPLFALLAATDLPYNRAPSMHISVLVILAVRFTPLLGGWRRAALHGWFLLIALSVLTTWQHHVIDIPAGMAAAGVSLWLAGRWTIGAPWSNPSPTVLESISSSRRAAACWSTSKR
jgi:hypothetical protein